MSELVKIKIKLEYEFVGRNIYGDKINEKLARDIFQANRREIIDEASQDFEFEASEVRSAKDLPIGYNEGCLPWMPSILHGDKESDLSIGEILKGQK